MMKGGAVRDERGATPSGRVLEGGAPGIRATLTLALALALAPCRPARHFDI